MEAFRFVHAADIHLDSPLRGLSSRGGSAVELIRAAPRRAFESLITRTIDERASFLIIAGDLYDGDWRDYQTGLFFVRQMGRLRAARIPAFLIYGNHDAASQLTRRLNLPDNVTAFSDRRPETRCIDRLGVALHGQSFRRRDVTDNLARGYPDARPGHLNIGVLHTGLAGEEGHASYAPCTLDELVNKGYDYWALGHIHQPSIRHEHPWVAYSGNIQGRHIGEAGPRGANLVSVAGNEIEEVDFFEVDVVRWGVIDVPAEDCDSLQDLFDAVREAVEHAVSDRSDGRLLACRVVISGKTSIHSEAMGSRERIHAEAQAAAESLGEERAWIEKVKLRTVPRSAGTRDPALAELLGDIPLACSDEHLQRQVRESVGKLATRLPPEAREGVDEPMLQAAIDHDFERLIRLAGPYAAARLLGGGGGR